MNGSTPLRRWSPGRLMPKRPVRGSAAPNILLAILSFCVSLCVVEAALRFKYRDIRAIRPHETRYDWKAATWEGTQYGWDLYHEVLGWVNKPGYRGGSDRTGEGGFRVAINSLGARGATEVPYEKVEASRIVVLGDSFAFGEDVDDEETFPFLLGTLMDEGTEVVNLGVHGYGTDQMALMLREKGCRYGPDIVVVSVFYHDILRCRSDYYIHAKPFYRLVDGVLDLVNVPVPGRPEPLGPLDRYCFTWAFVDERLSRMSQMKSIENFESVDREELWGIQTGLFRMMKDLCGEGTRVVVVSIADPGDLEAEWFPKFDHDLGRLIREEVGISGFISTLEPLKEAYRDYGAAIHTANGHLSPIGNRIVAGLIRDHIAGPGRDHDRRAA